MLKGNMRNKIGSTVLLFICSNLDFINRWMPLVEQELLTLLEHLSSSPF